MLDSALIPLNWTAGNICFTLNKHHIISSGLETIGLNGPKNFYSASGECICTC